MMRGGAVTAAGDGRRGSTAGDGAAGPRGARDAVSPNALRDTVPLTPARSFAGLALDRPLIMGIVNVTPDSFSDGGQTLDPKAAITRGKAMLALGADLIDVGGESTRPGAEPVAVEEERDRVVPVIRALAAVGASVSVDTRHAAVMRDAIIAGATIVNDISALAGDPLSLSLVADAGVGIILMHMQGDPRTMQVEPRYTDVVGDVYDWLGARVDACLAAGISRDRIAIDPGIGFGKTLEHNLALLGRLDVFRALGCALTVGLSRKSFIGRLSRKEPPDRRLPGSLSAALAAAAAGAHILRVHDVGETWQALHVWQAIADARQSG
ncbi:MAG: dihydropteroate synthase [Rhodospirillales bacterium]|nr:dihydropteroate synthase [Rhodospirillales bacterium]